MIPSQFRGGYLAASGRLREAQFSPIVMAIELAERVEGLATLSQGAPDFLTPDHILTAAIQAITAHKVDAYSATSGLAPLRELICNKLQSKNGISADPEQVIVTAGANQGVMLALLLLADPGDGIILISPSYASHIEQVYLAGMHPLFVHMDKDGEKWHFEAGRIEEEIHTRITAGVPLPRSIIICTPHNPTGVVLSKDVLIEIGEIAARYGIGLITDEAYEDFVFEDREHYSLASEGEISRFCVSCFSFSKSYAMTGWRVGYMVVPASLAAQARVIHDNLAICAPVVSQYAALAALAGPQHFISDYRDKLEMQRHAAIDAIQRLRFLDLMSGHGAFYLFPEIAIPMSSPDLCRRLAEEARVLVVPGKGFGPTGAKHVRISFTGSVANLKEAFERLSAWEASIPPAMLSCERKGQNNGSFNG